MKILTELRPNKEHFAADAIAGLTFAVVNIPQAMANALLATVNPILGLFTLAVATPIGAIFTGSVYMNVSTTSALSLAVADALVTVPAETKQFNLMALVLIAGILQLAAGLLKLGSLIRFVSKSVMVGFTTGIALLIILGQVGDLTGYDSRFSGKILQLADTILRWQDTDWATLAIGLLTIGLIVLFNQTRIQKISLAVALVIATIIAQLLSFETVALVGETISGGDAVSGLSGGIGTLSPYIFTSAAAIAIIGLVQGAGVSQSYPNPDGKYPNVSRDFVGQGLANMATSLFRGIPAGGSMSGTALVVNSGARTRWANILAGLLVMPLVLVAKGFIGLVPMATLAGLLIVVGFQSLQPEEIRTIWNTGRIPQMSFGFTLVATLVLPLQMAVFIGVAVSFMLYVFSASNKVTVKELNIVPKGYPIETPPPEKLEDDDTVLLMMYGSLFFAGAATFEQQLPEVGDARRAVVIMRLRGRDEIGSTLIGVISRYAETLAANGGRLLLTGVSEEVFEQMKRTGLVDLLGADGVNVAQPQIGVSVNRALETVDAWRETDTE